MKDTVLISPKVLRQHLDTFSSYVYSDARWVRLPYTEWRNANVMSSSLSEAMIKITREKDCLVFSNGEKVFRISTDAWTFGSYIIPKIFEDAQDKITVSGPCIKTDGSVSLNDCSYIDIDGSRYYPTTKNNDEEKDTMNTNSKFMNFEFGPVNESSIRMSLYGLAVKNVSGTWVSYDANTRSIMDVDILNFNGRQFMYKVPVAINAVAVGDIVIHARKPMFVTEVKANSLMAIDPVDGEYKEIVLTKSPFGFNFVTKVVNLMDGFMNTPASQENPFGNMWMLMAMNGDEGKDIDPMMLMLMMSNGGQINPMVAMMVMNGMGTSSDKDMMKWFVLSQAMGNGRIAINPFADMMPKPNPKPNETDNDARIKIPPTPATEGAEDVR